MITSIPNLLTISRVVAIPVIVALFYVDGPEWQWLACALFSAAAITDYLDGYFARAWREQSAFGRFLDPVADKLLVAAVILMLVAFDRISRSEEHTSELQSLMRLSYAVFCLKKKKPTRRKYYNKKITTADNKSNL